MSNLCWNLKQVLHTGKFNLHDTALSARASENQIQSSYNSQSEERIISWRANEGSKGKNV